MATQEKVLEEILSAMDSERPSILDGIDQIVETASIQKLSDLPAARRSIVMAASIRQMRALMTRAVVEQHFMPLMNTRLGFRCDRPNNRPTAKDYERQPYDWETVRDCLIEGFLRGARAVGNEINIIAGNCYLTLEFYRRVIREVPGVTDVKILPGIPVYAQDGRRAFVPFEIEWTAGGEVRRYERLGKQGEYDRRIVVRCFESQTEDAPLGKAERKALRGAYEEMTGCSLAIDDEDNAVNEVSPQRRGIREPEALPEPEKTQAGDAAPDPAPSVYPPITDKQHKRLMAICTQNKVEHEALKMLLEHRYDLASSRDIPTDKYDEIVAWAERGGRDAE